MRCSGALSFSLTADETHCFGDRSRAYFFARPVAKLKARLIGSYPVSDARQKDQSHRFGIGPATRTGYASDACRD
jgi:hypothetical protein